MGVEAMQDPPEGPPDDTPKDSPRDTPKDPPRDTPERREERHEESRKEPAERQVLCSRCYTKVPAEHLGSHMYHAHGEERRKATPPPDAPKDPPTPKPKTKTDPPADSGKAKSKSRWAEVRSGWH